MTNKEWLIERIKDHQYYEDGVLEAMTEAELLEIWNRLIDWIGA